MKIKIQRREGTILEPVPMHQADTSGDAVDIPMGVYDAWLAWQAQGETLQLLLGNLCIRQGLEAEVVSLKAERQSLWAGAFGGKSR